MLYRLKGPETINVNVDGVDYVLSPSRDYDDADPTDKALVKRWRDYFREAPDVEQATAAPGEKRTTKRAK